jgi:hypothetical protein
MRQEARPLDNKSMMHRLEAVTSTGTKNSHASYCMPVQCCWHRSQRMTSQSLPAACQWLAENVCHVSLAVSFMKISLYHGIVGHVSALDSMNSKAGNTH